MLTIMQDQHTAPIFLASITKQQTDQVSISDLVWDSPTVNDFLQSQNQTLLSNIDALKWLYNSENNKVSIVQ